MQVYLVDLGPHDHTAGSGAGGGTAPWWWPHLSSCSWWWSDDGAQLGKPCELCHGSLSWQEHLDLKAIFTKDLLLCGNVNDVAWSLHLGSRNPAGQREDEYRLSADPSVGTHTLQGVGVNQLWSSVLENKRGWGCVWLETISRCRGRSKNQWVTQHQSVKQGVTAPSGLFHVRCGQNFTYYCTGLSVSAQEEVQPLEVSKDKLFMWCEVNQLILQYSLWIGTSGRKSRMTDRNAERKKM